MLLVVGRVSGNLQAEDTQQEARVSVEAGKVLQDIRVEGRAIRTHLQVTPESARPEDTHPLRSGVRGQTHLADVRHLSWFVVGLHVVEEGRLVLKRPLTDTTHTYETKTGEST